MNAMNMKTRKLDLSSRAMLVQLSIGQWTARKLDRKVSAEVALQHDAKRSAGNYNKVLLARGNLAAIAQVASQARADHADASLPWMQDGSRILPVDAYGRYTEVMRKHRVAFEREVKEFIAAYPEFVEQARDDLGALFNAADYPSARDVARRFHWSVTVLPMPDAADFRVDMDAATVAMLQADVAASVQDAVSRAMGDASERLHRVVRAMADKLAAYKPDLGKQGNPFRDSLVENVREVCDVLPLLNLTGDARLAAAIEQVRDTLAVHDAQALREDETLRRDVAAKADAIADAMAGWM